MVLGVNVEHEIVRNTWLPKMEATPWAGVREVFRKGRMPMEFQGLHDLSARNATGVFFPGAFLAQTAIL